MPTILHILNFTPRKRGGVEKFLIALSARCAAADIHTVLLFAGRPADWFLEEIGQHAAVHWVDGHPLEQHYRDTLKLTRQVRPAVVTLWYISLFSPKTLLLTRLPWVGRTIYFDRTSRDVVDRSGALQCLAWLRGRIAAPCYWRVMSVSEHNRQRNVLSSFLPENKTQVIYNGVEIPETAHDISRTGTVEHVEIDKADEIETSNEKNRSDLDGLDAFDDLDALDDLDAFDDAPSPQPPAQSTKHQARPPYFLFAGQLTRDKGVHTLLAAYREFRRARPRCNIQLWLAGDRDGHCNVEIPDAAGSEGDTIRVLDMRDDVPELMARSVATIVPSEWPEACSFVSLEAMASGRPVVASDAGSLPTVLGDTGAVFAKGDSAALADILIDIADHPEKYDTLAKAARERARAHFSIDRMLDDYVELLKEALKT